MRVLVVSNCATRGYVSALQAAFPGWDIRGIEQGQADRWAEEGHEGFLGFIAKLDILFGFCSRGHPFEEHVTATARRIDVPGFLWAGLHPDAVWLHGLRSPLGHGVTHSRLIVSAWLAGKDAAATRALFCRAHMERIGYLDAHDHERDRLLRTFSQKGIDLAAHFARWRRTGNFLHTPNHPASFVLFDIALAAMKAADLSPLADESTLARAREDFDDYLGRGILWRLYPEIAARQGITTGPDRWREALDQDKETWFGLDEMITRSRAILDNNKDRRDEIMRLVGGETKAAHYVDAA